MQGETAGRPKRTRRFITILLGVVVVLVLLVALAPTLLSFGPAAGIAERAIGHRVNGSVAVEKVALSWFGGQRVAGLEITQDDGTKAVDVDVDLAAGLLALLLDSDAPLNGALTGTLRGTLHANGTTSFAELLRDDDADGDGGASPSGGASADAGGGLAPIDFAIDDLSVELRDDKGGRDLVAANLAGAIRHQPGEATSFTLAGPTRSGDLVGRLDIDVEAVGLIDDRGRVAPSGASLRGSIVLDSLPLLMSTVPGTVDRLAIEATAEDLASQVVLSIEGDATLEGHAPGRVEGRLLVDAPFTGLGLDRISGLLECTGLPTSMIQPFLADLGLDVERDIGPTIDVVASSAAADGRQFQAAITSEHLEVRTGGRIVEDTRMLVLGTSRFRATVDPELLASFAPLRSATPRVVTVALDAAKCPLDAESGAPRFGELAMLAVVTLDDAVEFRLDDEGDAIGVVDDISVQLGTRRLADGLALTGEATLDGAPLRVEELITGLVSEDGRLDLAGARPTGRSELDGLPVSTFARLFGEAQRPMVMSVFGETVDVSLVTAIEESDALRATLTLADGAAAPHPSATIEVVEHADRLEIERARAAIVATNDLLAGFFEDDDHPTLAGPAVTDVLVDAFTMTGTRGEGYAWPKEELWVRASTPVLEIDDAPGVMERVRVVYPRASVSTTMPEAASYVLSLDTELEIAADGTPLGIVTLDGVMALGADGAIGLDTASARFDQVFVGAWERVTGRDPGSLEQWLSSGGVIDVNLIREDDHHILSLISGFPAIDGQIDITLGQEFIEVSDQLLELRWTPGMITQHLNPGMARADGPAIKPAVMGMEMMRVQVSLADVRLPYGFLTGDDYDPADVRLACDLDGDSLLLRQADGLETGLTDIETNVTCAGLDDGVRFSMKGRSSTGTPATMGSVDVSGSLAGLVGADGAVDWKGSRLQLDGRVDGLATVLVDRLGDFDGLLIDALGPTLALQAVASDFGGRGGRLEQTLTSASGTIEAKMTGGEDALRIVGEDTGVVTLQLTPGLSRRVLRSIQPLLGELRTTENPITATIRNAVIPTDGDISRLSADIDIVIGAVEFDGGAELISLISMFDKGAEKSVPGYVNPAHVEIRNGVVSYDRFDIQLDKFTMSFHGQIDLNTRQANLATELPVASLGKAFRELRQLPEGLMVPLALTGSLDALQFGISPSFNPVEQVIPGLLEDLINRNLKKDDDDEDAPDLGGLLGDLFGPKKKKDEEEKPK